MNRSATSKSRPRVLFYDIETTHNLVAVFQLYGEDYIPHDNLLQERYVVCAAWRWEGESTVHGVSVLDHAARFKANPHDDRHVVVALHGVLSQADVVVAHNGDKFDMRFFAARALSHGLPALPPVPSVDTLKVAKARFLFNSNRLDYLGQFLGLGRKKTTPKGLWLDVLRGDKAAIRTMLAYNKQDVVLLEAVYRKLRPYVKLPFIGDRQDGCPRCGSDRLQSRGVARTSTRLYQRFQCRDCGGWTRATKADRAHRPGAVAV